MRWRVRRRVSGEPAGDASGVALVLVVVGGFAGSVVAGHHAAAMASAAHPARERDWRAWAGSAHCCWAASRVRCACCSSCEVRAWPQARQGSLWGPTWCFAHWVGKGSGSLPNPSLPPSADLKEEREVLLRARPVPYRPVPDNPLRSALGDGLRAASARALVQFLGRQMEWSSASWRR
jgi:hypothetical protein